MSAELLLDHLAGMKGISARGERRKIVQSLLHQTNLWDVRKRNLGTFSGGMKQRFGIAQALPADPKLIIVDEPTAGLDPAERNRFLNLLGSIGTSKIVILSTHIVEDVSELCSRMAIINRGEVLVESAPQQAIDELAGRMWKKTLAPAEGVDRYAGLHHIVSTHLVGGLTQIRVFAQRNPADGFLPTESTIGDVYFLTLNAASAVAA
jgi:ABC-type multidrug transport system ATPase subunit